MKNDLTDLVQPLIKPEFEKVVDLSHKLVQSDITSMGDLKNTIVELSGYLFFIGTVWGKYRAERKRKYAQAVLGATGTATDKDATGIIACAEEYKYELIFENMFTSVTHQINSLKKTVDIKMIELSKSGGT